MTMRFQFTIQPYQTAAVESIVHVFDGQPYQNHFTYRRDIGGTPNPITSLFEEEDDLFTGFANAPVALTATQLLSNIQEIQKENHIHLSPALSSNKLGTCSLDVEMETGTGKTYVYIKTMFELNQKYGWSKFIVVVPSLAIREGVRKSFETMESHFMETYGKKARFFIYDSKNLAEIDNFSQSADIQVMIINVQAFNARGKDARRIRTELDVFGSRRPIDVIQKNRPILILDEPQKMGGQATQKSLEEFSPLFCLNYSATHRQHHNLVYVLDALDAYNQKLVKQIEVKGIETRNLPGTSQYLYLENIQLSPKKPPMARLEFEIHHKNGIRRETRILGKDDNLYPLSGYMEQYQGYHISDIDPVYQTVTFTNGEVIHTGEVLGDITEKDLRRIQIRETILSHFEKEKELFSKGIKTLSLFFIDEVAKYRKYDENGTINIGEYGIIFEEEYNTILPKFLSSNDNNVYSQYLRSINVHKTHTGYFSIDKKGHSIDSKVKRGQEDSDDISAYDLILKDKERLLSFDNPVRFIFSHSALREGWDNPNVFQICTLKRDGSSPSQKRQEVGRGLRLCVNQQGERQDVHLLGEQVHQVNRLTVIASAGYDDFVKSLQEGIQQDLYDRPTQASADYFKGKTIRINENDITITDKQSRDIYRYLARKEYIDDDDHITDTYRQDTANHTLAPLPESCQNISEGVHALIRSLFDIHALDHMIPDGHRPKILENKLNDNFSKKEFQDLWHRINHKYTYRVNFQSDSLIEKCITSLNANLSVPLLQYTVITGKQQKELSSDQLHQGTSFIKEYGSRPYAATQETSLIKYDLIGEIVKGTQLTRRSIARILTGIQPITFAYFQKNPEAFIARIIKLINAEKADLVVEHITYDQTNDTYEPTIFTAERNTDFTKAYPAKKNVQDYVFTDGYAKDGQSIERKFAENLDIHEEVCVYAKLPKGFSIPTPMGNYSPDWAIAFYAGTVKHIYFIAETKGTTDNWQLRDIEKAKIHCAKALFSHLAQGNIVYQEVDSYEALMDIMNKS